MNKENISYLVSAIDDLVDAKINAQYINTELNQSKVYKALANVRESFEVLVKNLDEK